MKIHSTIAYLLLSSLIMGCASNSTNDVPPSSSYACQSAQVSGSSAKGEGRYGCYFYLHHPTTNKILVNTAYHLAIYQAPANGSEHSKPSLTLDGETDARGRSGYVRADFPITPDRVRFVERIGSGLYGFTPRLIRPTDGLAIPGLEYYVTWCGAPYTGTTDEQGNGVDFSSKSAQCAFNVSFYRKR